MAQAAKAFTRRAFLSAIPAVSVAAVPAVAVAVLNTPQDRITPAGTGEVRAMLTALRTFIERTPEGFVTAFDPATYQLWYASDLNRRHGDLVRLSMADLPEIDRLLNT